MALRKCPVHGLVTAVKRREQWSCPECGKPVRFPKRPSEGLRHQTFTAGGK